MNGWDVKFFVLDEALAMSKIDQQPMFTPARLATFSIEIAW